MPACYRIARGRRSPRPTIPGPSCNGLVCRLNTDNTDHPPNLLMSTLILILSRPGRQNGLRLRDKQSRLDPKFASGESGGIGRIRSTNSASSFLSTLLNYKDTLRITVALHCRGRCEVHERRESNAVDAVICEEIGEHDSCRSTGCGADCFRVCPAGESRSNNS
jgi:hypothetical protein